MLGFAVFQLRRCSCDAILLQTPGYLSVIESSGNMIVEH
jgi:hypothetical protein